MISEEAAALKVPQANVHCICIVLIGFGSAADFIQSFEKDRKVETEGPCALIAFGFGNVVALTVYCLHMSSHLSSHLICTNQEGCNMSDDTAAVELAQAHVNCVDCTEVVLFSEFHKP